MFLTFRVDVPYQAEAYAAVPVIDSARRMVGCAILLRGDTFKVAVAKTGLTSMLGIHKAWLTPATREVDGREYLESLQVVDCPQSLYCIPVLPEEVTEA